ncbi:MAG: hypothetical protein ACOC5R_03535, partial [Elusimicrobiota bacterium]
MKLKIAPKFILVVSGLIILTSVILSYIFINYQINVIKGEEKKRADSLARSLAYNAEYGVLTENKELLDTLLSGYIKEKDVIWVEIRNNKDNVLSSFGEKKKPFYETSFPVVTRGIERKGEEILFEEEESDRQKQMMEQIGSVNLAFSLKEMYKMIGDMREKAIFSTLLVIIIGIGISFFLIRFITEPIKKISMTAKKISFGDLSHKVE